jgi:hypothetical protein
MSKLVQLIVCCLCLLPASLLFSPKAIAQTVGLRECDEALRLNSFNPVSKIRQASLSLSPRGYILTIVEENEVQTFGLTNQLDYYYASSRLFQVIEGIRPALITSDGSFRLAFPVTPRNGCIYTGKLTFVAGAKEKLFPSTDSRSACRSAFALAQIKLSSLKNVHLLRSEKFSHNYSDYPDGRHSGYKFVFHGTDVRNVLASPVFLTTISTDIISNCKDIGIVEFGKYQTDNINTYGLLRNNKVTSFQCINPTKKPSTKKPSWGEVTCV